jgi:hypothetical protein
MKYSDTINLIKLYEDYTGTGNQSNYPSGVHNDNKNSYTTQLNGPGNGPTTPPGGAPNVGDIFEFPSVDNISAEELLKLFKQKVKKEIQAAKDKEMKYALSRFKKLYSFLIELNNPETDEE